MSLVWGCAASVGVDGGVDGFGFPLHEGAEVVGGAGLEAFDEEFDGARAVVVGEEVDDGFVASHGFEVDVLEAVIDVVVDGGVACGVVAGADGFGHAAVEVGVDGDFDGCGVVGMDVVDFYPVGVSAAGVAAVVATIVTAVVLALCFEGFPVADDGVAVGRHAEEGCDVVFGCWGEAFDFADEALSVVLEG